MEAYSNISLEQQQKLRGRKGMGQLLNMFCIPDMAMEYRVLECAGLSNIATTLFNIWSDQDCVVHAYDACDIPYRWAVDQVPKGREYVLSAMAYDGLRFSRYQYLRALLLQLEKEGIALVRPYMMSITWGDISYDKGPQTGLLVFPEFCGLPVTIYPFNKARCSLQHRTDYYDDIIFGYKPRFSERGPKATLWYVDYSGGQSTITQCSGFEVAGIPLGKMMSDVLQTSILAEEINEQLK